MKYLSVCSGIGTDHLAWHDLGWECVGFAEIEAFPSAVLSYRYPEIKNYGDFTKISDAIGPIDVLVGGTPCQEFSIANEHRGGIQSARGNLALEFVNLIKRTQPKWVVWENVPGVLSSGQGRDFGSFIHAISQLGFDIAWRVLDSGYFGLPQRRQRVFVVAGSRAAKCDPSKVLLDSIGVPRNRRAGGEATQETASGFGRDNSWKRVVMSAEVGEDDICPECGGDYSECPCPGPTQEDEWTYAVDWDGQLWAHPKTEPFKPYVPKYTGAVSSKWFRGAGGPSGDECYNLVAPEGRVRRLTPLECERLQGLPDNWTAVQYRGKPATDVPRYKAIGNGIAMPVLRWIGEQIVTITRLAA